MGNRASTGAQPLPGDDDDDDDHDGPAERPDAGQPAPRAASPAAPPALAPGPVWARVRTLLGRPGPSAAQPAAATPAEAEDPEADDLEAATAPASQPFFATLRARVSQYREQELPNTDPGCFPDLSWKTRIQGFAVCCGLGLLLSVLSLTLIGRWVRFGILFTLGNLLSLASSGFLVGPQRQLRVAFSSQRALASSIYLGSMVLTLVAALWLRAGLLVLLLCVVQYAAWLWYCLSYIPGAHRMARRLLSGCLSLLD
eukprot:EG_transcript_23971